MQGWEFPHQISEPITRFLPKKVSEWAISSKVSVSLIFGERPEQFAHNYSFLLRDLNKLLKVAYLSWPTWAIRSLGSEGMRESFAFLKSFLKNCKNIQKYDFFVFFSANCSFLWAKEQMSDSLKKTSDSLICLFIMSDLS